MRLSFLHVLVLLVILFNLFSTFLILYETRTALRPMTGKASSQGTVEFCLNARPTLNVPCDQGLSQGQPYACELNGSDDDGDPLTFSAAPVAPDTALLFAFFPNGTFFFTPNSSQLGYHAVIFTVNDSSECSNNAASVLFEFSIAEVNDPPILVSQLPNVSLNKSVASSPFSLDDYFSDPENDVLAYRAVVSSATLAVTIANDSTVTFLSSTCSDVFVRFIANDSELETQSNLITVETMCPSTPGGPGGGGGGGGSGGGFIPCDENFTCSAWSACFPNGERVQVCHDLEGCSDDIELREPCGAAALTGCLENWYCFSWSGCTPDGIQRRSCEDLMACGTNIYQPLLERRCNYAPSCENGIRDGEELGVDCGGNCGPCAMIQRPASFFSSETSPFFFPMLLLILLLSALLALMLLYRERLEEGVLLVTWLVTRHHERVVLVDPTEKSVLGEKLNALVDFHGSKNERLSAALRTYLSYALKIPYRATAAERADALSHLNVPEALRMMLLTASERLTSLEMKHVTDELLFATWREELRLLVWMTSDAAPQKRSIFLPVTPAMSFRDEILVRILNSYAALNRLDLRAAKHEYLAILRAYEELDGSERAEFYPELHRLYLAIGYVQQRKGDVEVS